MPVTPGAQLGPYELLAPLGAGGMGEVWLATELRLGRKVALKLVPAELTNDSLRGSRFEQEARAASALNHPHVCVIHALGTTDDGQHYIAMEYVEGETLRARVRRTSVTIGEAVEIASQIASALIAAHAGGIVHRDIKPENVMLRPDGFVKVLDFGLAKLAPAGPEIGADTTRTVVRTEPGTVVGTVAYMSPEQARGQDVDARTDVWALGCVLYEMIAGRSPFEAATISDVLAAILDRDPLPLARSAPDVPPELQRIVTKALRKDRDQRYQTMRDVGLDLNALRDDERVKRDRSAAVTEKDAGRGIVTRRWTSNITAVATAIIVAVAGVWYFTPRAKSLTNKDTILLSDFTNQTGDRVFDDTLKQGLSVQLEQSPFLNLLSDRKITETLKLMGRPANDRLTPEVTHEVCQRTGSTAIVTGSIAALGSQYVIGLKAVNCNTGDVLGETQQQAAGKESVLKGLDAAAVSLRSKLGESLNSVQKYATPLEQATTPSLEALKAYSLGMKAFGRKEAAVALPLFKRALEVDPNFAMAHSIIDVVYEVLGNIDAGTEHARQAYALREKVSERERFAIENRHYHQITGELEKMAQNLELWRQTYPRDSLAFQSLGFNSAYLGNWEKALEAFREAQRLDVDSGIAYAGVATADIVLGRLDEAEAVYKQAEARKLENEMLASARYALAFLKGDQKKMAQIVSAAMGNPAAEHWALASQADTEAWYGKLRLAHELTLRAIDSAQHNIAKENAAAYQAGAAMLDVEVGHREQARAEARAALTLPSNRFIPRVVALVLARAGDTAGAEKLAAELDKAHPLNTTLQRYWLPSIHAAIALKRQDPKQAIEILKAADALEFCSPGPFNIVLLPAYLRGDAYLMLRNGKRAAEEFQKFVDHPGLVGNSPLGALARLGLARAYALQSDTAKARAAYQDFLTLWKDADPDLPPLKQAQGEYARLK